MGVALPTVQAAAWLWTGRGLGSGQKMTDRQQLGHTPLV